MATFIAVVALAISIYTLLKVEKLFEKDASGAKKEIINNDRLINTLRELKDHDCEIVVKKAMFQIDIPYSVEGKLQDVDDEWVLIKSGKKEILRMIRIATIEDVRQLTKEDN